MSVLHEGEKSSAQGTGLREECKQTPLPNDEALSICAQNRCYVKMEVIAAIIQIPTVLL